MCSNGLKATRAGNFELAGVAALETDVLHNGARPAVLFNQIGSSLDGERRDLCGLRPIIDGSGLNGNIERKRFALKIDKANQHKRGLMCGEFSLQGKDGSRGGQMCCARTGGRT